VSIPNCHLKITFVQQSDLPNQCSGVTNADTNNEDKELNVPKLLSQHHELIERLLLVGSINHVHHGEITLRLEPTLVLLLGRNFVKPPDGYQMEEADD